VTVREAQASDIPELVEMGARFHAMSPHRHLGDYDREGIAVMLEFMIASPSAAILTNGTGLIGGVLAPIYFAPSKLMLEESFWWAGAGGGELLKAFEHVAKVMGASCVLLSTLENDRSDAMGRVMKRNGYTQVERRHIKELS